MPTEPIYAAVGLVLGAAAAWVWATGRARGAAARELGELRAQLGASEGAASELRQQLAERERQAAALSAELATAREERTAAQTRLEEAARSMEAQKRLLEEAEKRFKEAFDALSLEALRRNNEVFSRQAEEKIKPLREALERFDRQLRELEQARQSAYGGVREQLGQMKEAHERLQKETANLVTALRAPQVRGRWGEITLRRVVEVAGMSAHCDFVEQPSVEAGEGRLRPDLIVTLPGNRTIVVDSKAPLTAYLAATETENPQERAAQLVRHARNIRAHMQNLSGKAYWSQFDAAPEFVVMFLPGESFFSAALEQDRRLIEDGIDSRVVLATPTTLIALLRTVAYTWQQQNVAENAQRIAVAGRELFDRACTFVQHLSRVGDGLRRATGAYNDAVASWASRVVPSGRRMSELGVAPEAEFPALEALDALPRPAPGAAADGAPPVADGPPDA